MNVKISKRIMSEKIHDLFWGTITEEEWRQELEKIYDLLTNIPNNITELND